MIDFVEFTDDLVDELSQEELKDFLYSYNKYVINYFDEHDEGCYPVCMEEYFNNDYQVMLEGV